MPFKSLGSYSALVHKRVHRLVIADFKEVYLTSRYLFILDIFRFADPSSAGISIRHLIKALRALCYCSADGKVYMDVKSLFTSGLLERTFQVKRHPKVAFRYVLTVKAFQILRRLDRYYKEAIASDSSSFSLLIHPSPNFL